ncbi:hypothetical protein [Pyxidicoccus xibeiensis]|uniref:hypothetical protein n=1 Tax=Pyxidicoccus xibeiensis TaxID=2906759 RepID=UPI0020A707F1|nr:hypothetical protein [Pyxidicoccus xibeiensis]MCP3141710.1 hypothetical protein [Pyxidicoccus xibeiensis]
MAETSQTWWRGAWVRAVARTVKAWAEAVLSEEARTAAVPRPEAPGPTPAAPKDAGNEATGAAGSSVEALEERWLRDVQARQRGAAADWEARVKRRAPHLLEGMTREGRAPPRPRVASPRPGALPFARTAVKELHPVMRPEPPQREHDVEVRRDARSEAPVPVGAVGAARAPEPPPAPAPLPTRTGEARPEPGPDAVPPMRQESSWGLGLELPAAFTSRPSPVAGPARAAPPAPRSENGTPARRSRWDDLPAFADEPSPRELRAVPLLPEEERTLTELISMLPPVTVPRPRPSVGEGNGAVSRMEDREAPRNRVTFSVDDDAWAGAQSHLPWGVREPAASASSPVPVVPVVPVPVAPVTPQGFPSLEGEARSTGGAPASEPAHPWPELPPAPPEENVEVATELRQWERLRRLDREQRGE